MLKIQEYSHEDMQGDHFELVRMGGKGIGNVYYCMRCGYGADTYPSGGGSIAGG
ncbi:hypothetical protein KW805_02905 [Candidatus Pacearchaeota archaeon]|nr:hypothetical protein [Candidatus Pacearchaeota archaeon]